MGFIKALGTPIVNQIVKWATARTIQNSNLSDNGADLKYTVDQPARIWVKTTIDNYSGLKIENTWGTWFVGLLSSSHNFVIDDDAGHLFVFQATSYWPYHDNAYSLGLSDHRWSDIYAVNTHFGDLNLSDKICPVCRKDFKVGDDLVLHVKAVNKKEISLVPKHLNCQAYRGK